MVRNIPYRCLQAANRVRLYCRSTTRAILRKPKVKYFFYRAKNVYWELIKKTKLAVKQTRLYKVYWELIKKTKLAAKQSWLYFVTEIRPLYRHLSGWYQHQDLNRVIRSKTSRTLVALTLLFVFIAQLLLPNKQNALGATLLFTQSSWSGGASSTATAVDPTNRTNWTYFNTSTNIDFTSSTAPRLTSSSYSATDDQTFTSTGWATGGGFGNGTNDQTSVGAGTAITLATSSEVAFNAFDTSHSPIPGLVNSQIYDFQGISFANNYLYILQATSSGSGNGNVHRYDVVNKIWTSFPSLSLQYGINAYSAMKLDANFVYVKDSNETKVHRHTLANTTDAWQVFYNTGGSGTNSGGLYVDTNYIFTMPGNHGCENLKRHTVATTSGSW